MIEEFSTFFKWRQNAQDDDTLVFEPDCNEKIHQEYLVIRESKDKNAGRGLFTCLPLFCHQYVGIHWGVFLKFRSEE